MLFFLCAIAAAGLPRDLASTWAGRGTGPILSRTLQQRVRRCTAAVLLAATSWAAWAQTPAGSALPPVTVAAKANQAAVEKSYRRMMRGVALFEQERAMAPAASLRFKLLPRRRDTNMNDIDLLVLGPTVELSVPIAADQTFTLPRSAQALDEDARVTPNRKALSMTWRTDIRTPDLPPNTRRLGDLRLECRVGMASGLVSNTTSVIGRLVGAVVDTPAYCDRAAPLYLFFADRPVFSVTLVDGPRREVLGIDKLYAAASDDPGLKDDLPFCDCEVLIDRTYVLPLGDRRWSDNTLVVFEDMEAPS